jgi:crotonobetainyl-CoA:carnitine CoA-transferase CaiB-like acyl-CoA transferase
VLLGRPELAARQYDDDQEALATELARVFSSATLEHWLRVFDDEDVCVGPVATLAEAAEDLGTPEPGRAPALGANTESWRQELGL